MSFNSGNGHSIAASRDSCEFRSCFSESGLTTLPSTSSVNRLMLLTVTVALALPLGVATRLQPSASGLGTHQQLGLPPCTLRLIWGMRCPSCGMTTSWAHAVRGQWSEGFNANVGGMLLALGDGIAIAVMSAATWWGRWPHRGWLVAAAWGMVLIWTILIAQWACRLLG